MQARTDSGRLSFGSGRWSAAPRAIIGDDGGMRAWLLILALAAAVRVAVLIAQHNAPIDMDGADYARLGQNLHAAQGYVGMRGVPDVEFPPLFPGMIAALMIAIPDPQVAGTVAALICGLALVTFVWFLGRDVYGPRVAALAAGAIAIVPIEVTLSTTVLADMAFGAALVAGVWLLRRTLLAPSPKNAAGAAVAFALAYLARPEGTVYIAAGISLLVVAGLTRAPRLRVPALAFAVTAIVAMSPYLALTTAIVGKPMIEDKTTINADLARGQAEGAPYLAVADALDADGRAIGAEIDPNYYGPHAISPSIGLREQLKLFVAAGLHHLKDVVAAFGGRDYGYLLLPLALIGLVRSPWSAQRKRDEAMLLGTVVVYYVILGTVWQFWERYGAAFVPFVALWAALGVIELNDWSRASRLPRLGTVLAAVFAVACLGTNLWTALQPVDTTDRVAGAWVAARYRHPLVMDVSDHIAYYAGGSWTPIPYAPEPLAERYVQHSDADLVVLDGNRAADYPTLAPLFRHGFDPAVARLVWSGHRPNGTAVQIFAIDHTSAHVDERGMG